MPPKPSVRVIEKQLQEILTGPFPGMTVRASRSPRWKRTVLTFRWGGFDELLPEERFQRLLKVIPRELYEDLLRDCVWFELGSDESPEEYMKLPRSEDAGLHVSKVIERLQKAGFFEALAKSLGEKPQSTCQGDFSRARPVLRALGLDAAATREAILVLINRGASCDCQVVTEVRNGLVQA